MAYHDRSDVEDIFGVENVEMWADKDRDGDATKITNRIARGLVVSDNEFDEYLEDSGYSIPIQDADGSVPVGVTNICAILTGVWLYTSSGIEHYAFESGKMLHALSGLEHKAKQEMIAYKAGQRKIKDAVTGG